MRLTGLPFSAGAHASLEGGFVLIEFPEESDPHVVYVEGITGDVYLESVEEVKRYQSAFERNQAVALAPEESSAFLSALAREVSSAGKNAFRGSRERAGRVIGGHRRETRSSCDGRSRHRWHLVA